MPAVARKKKTFRAKPRKVTDGAVLTRKQIYSRYKDEWVLIANPVLDKHLEVVRGRVAFHSKDRDKLDREAMSLRLRESAYIYTGRMPKDAVIIL